MGINGFLQIQGIDLSIIREFDSVPVKGTTIKNTYFFILAILTICFFRQPEKRFIKKKRVAVLHTRQVSPNTRIYA
ncbi:MAG TPA: hypothetical protein DIC46_05660 [Porphyromonadaceae bacterium]|jgi:hypothetical protein|nr:hypothetical protein [Porphyromonadaceae bacterium]